MPIFEYKCCKCHRIHEVIQTQQEAEEVFICPNCSYTCRKLVSLGTFILKGNGWAADGYTSKGMNSGHIR